MGGCENFTLFRITVNTKKGDGTILYLYIYIAHLVGQSGRERGQEVLIKIRMVEELVMPNRLLSQPR